MKKKRKKKGAPGEPQRVTKAVTHIRLSDANGCKLALLDTLAPVYLALCQQYVTLFCTEEAPNKLRDPLMAQATGQRNRSAGKKQETRKGNKGSEPQQF